MNNLKILTQIIRENKGLLAEVYGVKALGIFGSYSQGIQRQRSDLDILVEFFRTPDLFEFVRLGEFLRRKLRVKVDIVTREALKPSMKKDILKETIFV